MKTVKFSETIAACDLKVGRYRQLIELMSVKGHGHLLTFGRRSFTLENINLLFSETTGPFLTKFCM